MSKPFTPVLNRTEHDGRTAGLGGPRGTAVVQYVRFSNNNSG